MCTKFVRKPKGEQPLQDLCEDGRVLKWILME